MKRLKTRAYGFFNCLNSAFFIQLARQTPMSKDQILSQFKSDIFITKYDLVFVQFPLRSHIL